MSQVAKTIAEQIGAQAFALMGTGKNKFSDGDALIFGVKGCKKWNKIKISLLPSDTYRVEFFMIRNFEVTTKAVDDVYVDMLHDIIEEETGLYLSLRPRT